MFYCLVLNALPLVPTPLPHLALKWSYFLKSTAFCHTSFQWRRWRDQLGIAETCHKLIFVLTLIMFYEQRLKLFTLVHIVLRPSAATSPTTSHSRHLEPAPWSRISVCRGWWWGAVMTSRCNSCARRLIYISAIVRTKCLWCVCAKATM